VTLALCFEAASVELGGRPVLERLDLAAAPGEWVALIGPNGAGKTTALRAAAGLVPYTGSIQVRGRQVSATPGRRLARELALVPQSPVAPVDLRVSEYVLLGRNPYISYFGRESRADLDAAARAISRLDLERFAGRELGSLSGGERQRAVLARALAQEPSLLLLDEPTGALDIGRQQSVLELVDCLRREYGLTVIVAMHDLVLAAQYADRLLLLSGGRVVADGPASEVLTEPNVGGHYRARVELVSAGNGTPAVIPSRPAPAERERAWRP
jgi:iron complex transport system ATP-binding protein